MFAVRNRIGYSYKEGELMATDLASKDGRSIAVHKAEPIVPAPAALDRADVDIGRGAYRDLTDVAAELRSTRCCSTVHYLIQR